MTGNARILIVDDEQRLVWTLGLLLQREGYDVVTFTDPLLVMEEVHRHPPALVISDVVMPGMSGIDLAVQLERDLPSCKVLLFSGQANTLTLLANAKAQGRNFEVFPKPILPQELLRLVASRAGTMQASH